MQELEERILGVEDSREEMNISVKENVKSKKLLAQKIQDIWDSMQRPNLRIVEVEEEEFQFKGTENIFNKTIKWTLPNPKKEVAYQGTRSIQNTM